MQGMVMVMVLHNKRKASKQLQSVPNWNNENKVNEKTKTTNRQDTAVSLSSRFLSVSLAFSPCPSKFWTE